MKVTLSDRLASHDVAPRAVRAAVAVAAAVFTFAAGGVVFDLAGVEVTSLLALLSSAGLAYLAMLAARRACLLPETLPFKFPAIQRCVGGAALAVFALGAGFTVASSAAHQVVADASAVGVGNVVLAEACPTPLPEGTEPGGAVYSVEWVNGQGVKATSKAGCDVTARRVGDRVGVRVKGDTVEVTDASAATAALKSIASTRDQIRLKVLGVLALAAALATIGWTGLSPMRGEPVTLSGRPLGKTVYEDSVDISELRSRRKAGPMEGIDSGWYPDPLNKGQLRYFNGTEWTTHTHM